MIVPERRRLLPFASLAICAFAVAACGSGADEKAGGPPPAPQVGFVVVQPGSVPNLIELAGRTSAYETSEVRPQVSGVIRRRTFTEGERVRAGQTLYEIDPRLYRAATNEAQANLASARATAEAARIRADRFRPLAKIEAISQQDFTDAEAQSRQAQAVVAQGQAQLETARINLRFTTVPAPISGRIGRSLATVGALVTANQVDPLAVIQRLDPIFVDIQQSSADLLRLRRSLARDGVIPTEAGVTLKLEDGSDYGVTGRVQFTEAQVDPATGTVTLRARFANPSGLLLPGMFVRALFAQTVDTGAYLVPQQGVARDAAGAATVLVVGPGDKVVQRKVIAPRTQGNMWVVTSGLQPGDRVIIQGSANARPGQPVRPVPASTAERIGPPPGGAEGAGAAGKGAGAAPAKG